jgi:hypothetical protein
MRFMILVKATALTEAGVMPEDDAVFAEMETYHEALAKAGVLLDAAGLKPSAAGWRIRYAQGQRTVLDGPFTETKELIAGYTLIQVRNRDEAMEWCENHDVDYVFGFAGNDVLHALTREAADAICVQRALSGEDKCRGFKAFRYGAKTWGLERRFVARIEATPKGLDVRYVVTSLKAGARHLYETLYCARGNAENLIKLHKSQLASDRTSCRDPKANQFRLILHTAAYWLLLTMRAAAPSRSPLRYAEFNTLRLRLIKIAARVVEGVARIRVFLPTACPDRAVFRALAGRLCAAGP